MIQYYNYNYNRSLSDNHDRKSSLGILSSGVKMMKKFSKSFIDVNVNVNDSETSMQRSVINDKLDDKWSQLTAHDQNELIKWLSVTIMQQFAFLMNDSFSRFRANQNELVLKLSLVTHSQSENN